MMPRFPETTPDLSLYALAQARRPEVAAACARTCKGCPGPEARDGCRTRKPPAVVLDRKDWPMCPLGMLKAKGWQELVGLYITSQASPLAGWPDAYATWAVEGMTELQAAIRAEEARQIKTATSGGGKSAPRGSGRRAAKAV